jgi:hypothetical protein
MRVFLLIAALFLFAGNAGAQTMNGRYQGIGSAEGLILELRQADTVIQGKVTGAAQWAINGQTDGKGGLTGMIFKAGQGQVPFQGYWTAGGLRIEVANPGGPNTAYDFVPAGQGPPAAQLAYYLGENGQPVGPFTLDEALGRIRAGGAGPQQPVWRSDMPAWATVAELPELQAALASPAPALAYYVEENGAAVGPLTLDDVLGRVRGGTLARTQGVWRSDTTAWAPAESLPELAAAFPATAAMPEVQYYIDDDGTATGPLTLDQVLARAAAGTLAATQNVWKSDTQAWAGAGTLTELQSAFAAPAPAADPGIQFYIDENGQTVGPLSTAEMHDRIRAGRLRPGDGVYNTLTKAIGIAEFYPELRPAFPPADLQPVSEYTVAIDGREVGPIGFAEMIGYIRDHRVELSQQIKTTDDRGMRTATEIVELTAALIASFQPPILLDRPLEYYIDQGAETVGPLTVDDMRQRVEQGELSADTWVWTSETGDWESIARLREFRAFLPSAAFEEARRLDEKDFTDALWAMVDANPQASSLDRSAAYDCLQRATLPLTRRERMDFGTAARAGAVDPEGGLDQAYPGLASAIQGLEAAHPGMGQAVGECS